VDEIKVFDNVNELACEDMTDNITKGSCVSIAAAFFPFCFSLNTRSNIRGVDRLQVTGRRYV